MFHYVSTYLVLSTLALLLVGSGTGLGSDHSLLVKFIALNYAIFAVWQIILAATSGIKGGVFRLFQWIFFVIIAALAWSGA